MLTARLVLRALRWRAGAAGCVLAVAAIAVAAAALGPMYLRAVDGGVLRQTLAAAPRADRDVAVSLSSTPAEELDGRGAVDRMLAPVLGSRWFAPAVAFETTDVKVALPQRGAYSSRLLHADGDCAHLRFVAGRCPSASGEAAVSSTTRDAGVVVGSDLAVTLSDDETQPLRVVGVYQPVDPTGDFWGGAHFFDAAPTTSDKVLPRLDSFVVSADTMGDLQRRVALTFGGDARLVVAAVRAGDLDQIDRLVAATSSLATVYQADGGSVGTALPSLLDDVRAEQRVPRTLVVVACVQLALLALIVLGAIVWSTAETQVDEAALARLRGRRLGSVVALAVGQPAVAVVVGLPVGLLVARVAAGVLSPVLIGPGGAVTVTANALWVAVAVAVAGVVVCVLAAGRALLSSVASLFHRAPPSPRAPAARLAAEAVAFTAAIAGVVELNAGGLTSASGGQPDALAVVVPTLLAVAAAIALLHLGPWAARPLLGLTRDRRRVASFIAVRQLVRRDTALRLSAVVAVATSVAVFAAASWSNAARNRQLRALGDVGAARVLTVDPTPGVDLVSAVRSADPSGHDAMAVEARAGAATPILAVDSARLPGIAGWVTKNSQYSLAQIAGWLSPKVSAPVLLTQTRVRVRAVAESLPSVPVHLVLVASDPERRQVRVDLGAAVAGSATYEGELSPDCARGCRLAGLTLELPDTADAARQGSRLVATVRYLDIETSADGNDYNTIDAGFTKAGRWQGKSADTPVAGADGLRVTFLFDPSTASWGIAVPTDLPLVLPAVIASGSVSQSFLSPTSTLDVGGLDGNEVTVDATIPAVSLPGLGRSGVMVDLTLARRAQTDVVSAGTVSQVWLARGVPTSLVHRLQAAGLTIVDDETARARQRAYDHSGPTYGIQMFLVMAVAAGALGAGVVLALGLLSARRRAYDYESLRVVGVAERVLRAAASAELAAALCVGLAVGVGAGVGGVALATGALPLFVRPDVGFPRVSSIPWPPVLVLCGALLLALGLICVVVVGVVRREANVGLLRAGR